MSDSKVPGVVLINKYDTHSTHGNFKDYLNYISRNDAVTPKDFNQYLEYMDNPEKQARLFTAEKDFLSEEEKEELKDIFASSEKRSGVMWETVISFDNTWLEENGLYDSKTGWTDEDELKRLTRGAVRRLEDQENLKLTWAGAVHHNTDNIHVHIASVEKIPRHKEKEFQIVEFPKWWLKEHGVLLEDEMIGIEKGKTCSTSKPMNGNYAYHDLMKRLKSAVQEETGRPFFCRNRIEVTERDGARVSLSHNAGAIPEGAWVAGTYKDVDATFKGSSMDAVKSYLVHEIIRDDDVLKKINALIRDQMVNPVRENIPKYLQQNEDIARDFMQLYHDLKTSGVSRRDWSYGTNKIAAFRPDIDKLSEELIRTYFPEEKKELDQLVKHTADQYRKAYGDNEKADKYQKGREKDLQKRMGNAILAGLREYDRQRMPQRTRSRSGEKKVPASRKKSTSNPHKSRAASQRARTDALEYALRQAEWEMRRALLEASQAEREQQYQFNRDISEEERLEKERIQQGERDAQASVSKY